jgi:hypothetical protein
MIGIYPLRPIGVLREPSPTFDVSPWSPEGKSNEYHRLYCWTCCHRRCGSCLPRPSVGCQQLSPGALKAKLSRSR